MKSKDPDYKYKMAIEYFNQGKYIRSQTLLDDVATYYKGTPRSEDVLAYLARSYMGQKNYGDAADYYQAYVRNYPKGKYISEARYQVGHCKYLDSPDARLDQAITREAIASYQEFVSLYPESPYAEQAYKDMEELNNKLARKEYLSAKLYYNMGTYLGNNYLSAEITAQNALRDYPGNQFTEDLNWIICASKYYQAIYSMPEKKLERARDAQDECYSFLTEWGESKYAAEVKKMDKELRKITHE